MCLRKWITISSVLLISQITQLYAQNVLLLQNSGITKTYNETMIDFLEYYPLNVGDEWHYKNYIYNFFLDETTFVSITNEIITGDTIINNKKYFIRNNQSLERFDTTSQILYYYSDPDSEVVGIDFNQEWGYDTTSVNDFGIILPQIRDKYFNYAKGVGLINYKATSGWGSHYYIYLIWAKIKGQIFESTTNVEERNELLTHYELYQNYPNPFNPKTMIKYRLSKSTHVTLSIYNINGQLVERLVNQNQEPGLHHIIWDAANIPSGVYFYQLKINNSVQTKKMILLR